MASVSKRKKTTKKYFTKFQDKWFSQEKYKEWIIKYDMYSAKCRWCCTKFTVKHDGEKSVRRHCASKEHVEASRSASNQILTDVSPSTSNSVDADLNVTAIELSLIYHGLNHHHSYLSTECGINLYNEIFKELPLCSKLYCGRTKIKCIVENVLLPKSTEMVLQEMRNIPFSISTDATNKRSKTFLPFVVRYFHREKGLRHKIIDFSENSSSEVIANQIELIIEKHGLDKNNLVSYGANNASVNCEKKMSTYENLKSTLNNNLIKSNCHCRILHNAAKYAVKALSYDVENLVAKVFAEFSHNSEEISKLKSCFDFAEMEYEKITRYSHTKWLSLFQAIERLISSWREIKIYFRELGEENCHKIIWDFIDDQEDETKNNVDSVTFPELYLYFVQHYMYFMTKSLLAVEKKNLTCIEVDKIMRLLKKTLEDNINKKFFGSKTISALKRMPNKDTFINEALSVYKKTLNYLEKWYDYDSAIYRQMEALNLESNNFNYENVWSIAAYFNITINDDKLYEEIRITENLLSFIYLNDSSLDEKWKKIFLNEACNAFTELPRIVQYIFAIPVNSSYVERIFSVVNNLWPDERNRLKVELIKAEVCVKENYNMKCKEFYYHMLLPEQRDLLRSTLSKQKYNK